MDLGAGEILLILAVVFLLFGARRLPDAARGLGRSLRIFKSEINAMNEDPKDGKPSLEGTSSEATVDAPAVKDSAAGADTTDR